MTNPKFKNSISSIEAIILIILTNYPFCTPVIITFIKVPIEMGIAIADEIKYI